MYHVSLSTFQRSKGQSICAAAAYRSGSVIKDNRYGTTHDYRKKDGIVNSGIVGWHGDRASLWNAAEESEKRKDSCIGREIRIALPDSVTDEIREAMILEFSKEITEKFGVAADWAIHRAGKDGDKRNAHAHILITSRPIQNGSEFAKKKDRQWNDSKEPVHQIREMWADCWNRTREKHDLDIETVDHRSNQARGIKKEPSKHRGPARTRLMKKGTHTPNPSVKEAKMAAKKAVEELEKKLAAEIKQTQMALSIAHATDAMEIKRLDKDQETKKDEPERPH